MPNTKVHSVVTQEKGIDQSVRSWSQSFGELSDLQISAHNAKALWTHLEPFAHSKLAIGNGTIGADYLLLLLAQPAHHIDLDPITRTFDTAVARICPGQKTSLTVDQADAIVNPDRVFRDVATYLRSNVSDEAMRAVIASSNNNLSKEPA